MARRLSCERMATRTHHSVILWFPYMQEPDYAFKWEKSVLCFSGALVLAHTSLRKQMDDFFFRILLAPLQHFAKTKPAGMGFLHYSHGQTLYCWTPPSPWLVAKRSLAYHYSHPHWTVFGWDWRIIRQARWDFVSHSLHTRDRPGSLVLVLPPPNSILEPNTIPRRGHTYSRMGY